MSTPEERDRVELLIMATLPLLDLFATVDDVFCEPDAMRQDNLQKGMGRIYRQYKKTRHELGGDDV